METEQGREPEEAPAFPELGTEERAGDTESGTSSRPCRDLRNIAPLLFIFKIGMNAAALTPD